MVGLQLFLSTYLLSFGKLANNFRIIQLFILATIWCWASASSNYTMFDDHLKLTPLISLYCCIVSALFLFALIPNLSVITILIGLLFLLMSDHLVLTFICFELININLYLLICTYSSGIKYIITSLILTTFFIFGIVLTYAGNGGISFLILIVFLLKLGILPFHQLTADLYDGIPTKIMILLQLPIKLGIFLKILDFDLDYEFPKIASLAIIIPALATQYAYTFKRFMSLSSTSYQTLLFMVMFTTNFSVANYSIVYIITLGLIMITYRQPLILNLLFLSVAGLPPFLGFYFKLYLINDLIDLGNFWLLIVFLGSSLILTANYLERSSFVLLFLPTFSIPSTLTSFMIGIILFWSCFAL